jgi:hypothetical protein
VSVTTTAYTQYEFTTTLVPPRSGIYYSTVAIFNPLNITFTVQNGPNQNTLSGAQATLFNVPTTGAPPQLSGWQAPFGGATTSQYGAFLGPVTAVWYESTETPGSYPVTLGPLSGLVQWTPSDTVLPLDSVITIVPTGPISQVILTDANPGDLIELQGYPSEALVEGVVAADGSLSLYPLNPGTDTWYVIADLTGASTATVSIVLAPAAVAPSGGGGGQLVNTKYTQDNYVIVGPIVLPTDAGNTILPYIVHVGAGQSSSYTGVAAMTGSGSVVGTIQHNGVDVPGLVGITITDTLATYAPTAQIVIADHDTMGFVPTDVSGSPVSAVIEFDRTDAS